MTMVEHHSNDLVNLIILPSLPLHWQQMMAKVFGPDGCFPDCNIAGAHWGVATINLLGQWSTSTPYPKIVLYTIMEIDSMRF